MSHESSLTPMMAQYRRIKADLPKDAILLFRLGDFYEMFFEDAQVGAQILHIALTRRGEVPMCGIPYHAANTYIARLLKAGRKVAICDQVEEAKPGKLVKRDVTAILSPGTHLDERMLSAERNSFLACVYRANSLHGLGAIDLTTGEFLVTEIEGENELLAELQRLRPAELVIPSEAPALESLLKPLGLSLTPYEAWAFAPETAGPALRDHFKVASLDGFGLKGRMAATAAAGAAVHYLTHHLRRELSHLTRLRFYQTTDFLVLDSTSLRNLEVQEPLHADAPRNTTLFGALNRTVTPMGARRLRDWLTQPLAAVDRVCARQDAVEAWLGNGVALENFRTRLGEVRDLERILGRLSVGNGNARDMVALRVALEQLPSLKNVLIGLQGIPPERDQQRLRDFGGEQRAGPGSLLEQLTSDVREQPALVEVLGRAIVETPPLGVKEGGIIREGFDARLDEMRQAAREGKDWIARLQQEEIIKTGIASLKVRFNSVFGYYIEVTKSHLEKVPAYYTRKQTVATGERFITPELKDMEGKILGAEERGAKLEFELFLKVREEILSSLKEIQQTASALGQLDVLCAFAENARLYNYCRPVVKNDGVLDIRDGRHPVLEQAVEERFVPNDVTLDIEKQQIALITGPNMAGKSTYIRQVALLALMAHTGAFVPASAARIDRVDRIFTRIGASDDLARGQSTFMVEMSEAANILNNATRHSLIILDEIGRGTSTFDGLSLAWSIVEHLHHQVGAKTLFATHYHELTELAARLPRVTNLNVAVREWNDQVIFLHKIQPGATDKSYGIQVARLAGIPRPVIDRSKQILRVLEEAELNLHRVIDGGANAAPSHERTVRRRTDRERLQRLEPTPQLDLFG